MLKVVLLFLLFLPACQQYHMTEAPQQSTIIDANEAFITSFNNSECTNPCWLGIEVGVTNQETVMAILEEHDIEYSVPGVILLLSIPSNSVPGINPQASLGEEVYGDINVGQQSSDIVLSIDFHLDLCMSTLVAVYGRPQVWFARDGIPHTLAYLNHNFLFSVDIETRRIEGIILHQANNMPSPIEVEEWSDEYSSIFSDECSDTFTP